MTVYDYYKDPTIKTRHANTGQVYINGVLIGEVAGISVREDGGTDGSYVVGDAKPIEHIHNRWSCSGSINRFVWRRKDSHLAAWDLSGKSLLNLPTFTITCKDEIDGSILFSLTGVTLSNRDMGLQANQRIMQNLSFVALNILEGGDGSGHKGGTNLIGMLAPTYNSGTAGTGGDDGSNSA